MEYLNIAIDNPYLDDDDIKAIFPIDEDVKIIKENEVDIFDLLVKLEAFKSKGQAKKNWNGPKEIPPGFSEFTIGKLKRQLTIWNCQPLVYRNVTFKSSLRSNSISGEFETKH